jgi:hypothetical protein
MAEAIADPTDFTPWNIWPQCDGLISELDCRLADDHQRVFDGEDNLFVLAEGLSVQPCVNRMMWSMFSMISAKRLAGSLEGTHCLTLHALSYSWLERPLFDQIDRLAKQVGDPVLDPDDIEQGQRSRGIEGRQQVNIRLWPRFPSRCRPEQ